MLHGILALAAIGTISLYNGTNKHNDYNQAQVLKLDVWYQKLQTTKVELRSLKICGQIKLDTKPNGYQQVYSPGNAITSLLIRCNVTFPP